MIQDMIFSILMAGAASAGFSVFYRVPRSEYLMCGLGGAICWIVSILIQEAGLGEFVAVFGAAMAVTAAARTFASWRKMPVTVYLVSSIFPFVPGSYIYYTVYYLLNGQNDLAQTNFRRTVVIALAIAMGIMLVSSFPAFRNSMKKRRTESR